MVTILRDNAGDTAAGKVLIEYGWMQGWMDGGGGSAKHLLPVTVQFLVLLTPTHLKMDDIG